jgi:hypothetical protein
VNGGRRKRPAQPGRREEHGSRSRPTHVPRALLGRASAHRSRPLRSVPPRAEDQGKPGRPDSTDLQAQGALPLTSVARILLIRLVGVWLVPATQAQPAHRRVPRRPSAPLGHGEAHEDQSRRSRRPVGHVKRYQRQSATILETSEPSVRPSLRLTLVETCARSKATLSPPTRLGREGIWG